MVKTCVEVFAVMQKVQAEAVSGTLHCNPTPPSPDRWVQVASQASQRGSRHTHALDLRGRKLRAAQLPGFAIATSYEGGRAACGHSSVARLAYSLSKRHDIKN